MSDPRPYDEDPQGSAPDEGGWSVNEQPRFGSYYDPNTPAFIDISGAVPEPQAAQLESMEVPQTAAKTVEQATASAIEDMYSGDIPAAEIAAEVQLVGDALPAFDMEQAPLLEEVALVDADTQPFDIQDPPQTVEEARLAALTSKIIAYPEVPVNYVLRGELHLSLNQPDSAAHDFEQAIRLAEALDSELDWGYLNASYIDRANEGLRRLRPGN